MECNIDLDWEDVFQDTFFINNVTYFTIFHSRREEIRPGQFAVLIGFFVGKRHTELHVERNVIKISEYFVY